MPEGNKNNGAQIVLWSLAVLFVIALLTGQVRMGNQGTRPKDIPGGIQWSKVTCHVYDLAGDDAEVCTDGTNFVNTDTAHSYGIHP